MTEDRPKRLFMKDFKPEDFEFKPFDVRFSLFGLLYPYETWEFFGRNGGFPAPMRKGNPFTAEYLYWIAKWVLVGSVPFFLAFTYGLTVSIMQKDMSAAMNELGGMVFFGLGIWYPYNLRRGYRAGLIAKAKEETQGVGKK